MLIYKLLGDDAQQQFARSWGVSYGMNAATEWKVRPACAARCAQPLTLALRPGRGDGGGEGRDHPSHLGAPPPDAQCQLAGGARCVLSIAACWMRCVLPTDRAACASVLRSGLFVAAGADVSAAARQHGLRRTGPHVLPPHTAAQRLEDALYPRDSTYTYIQELAYVYLSHFSYVLRCHSPARLPRLRLTGGLRGRGPARERAAQHPGRGVVARRV